MPDREKYIEQIKTLPHRLEQLLNKVGDKNFDTPYGNGKWTVRQVVHHLADSHWNGFARMKWIMTEDNPQLKAYDQDKWARLADNELSVMVSIQILNGLHQRMVKFFESLEETDWKRTAYHPDEGDLTMDWMLEAYAGHGEKHLGHISLLLPG